LPMYQGNNPLFASYDLNGFRMVCIDNSTYEILPEQLEFFRKQLDSGLPLLLMMHIPLYVASGKSLDLRCGHPQWEPESNRGLKAQKLEGWREGGRTGTTMIFRDEVFRSNNLLGIFTGHTHSPSLDMERGVPQVVTAYNATAAYSDIKIQSCIGM